MSDNTLRVLLYEDSKPDIELILDALRSDGYDVSADTAGSPEQLLNYAKSNGYDVILADYRMPHGSGMDVFEMLKSQHVETPFILVTGALGEERAVECLKNGVTDFV